MGPGPRWARWCGKSRCYDRTVSARRLLLHIGMPKTGSSALQSTLALNREELARQGVNYPEHISDAEAALGNVSSGNGGPLRPLIETRLREQAGDEGVARARDRLIETLCTTAADTVLYSQEWFFQYDPDLLSELDSLVGDLGVELGVIVYVRDVAPYVESIYRQSVKRRRYAGDLADFVSDYILRSVPNTFPLTRERIESAAQVLGPGRLHVMHYETERDRLAESLLVDTLGVERDTLDLGVRHVNRSLTHREVLWMRALNQKFTVAGAARLASDQIMAQPPQGDARLGLDAENLRRLENAFVADVDWINDAFFPDRRLAIGTCGAGASGPTPMALTAAETRLLEVVAGLANHAAREARAVPLPIEKELQRLRRTARRQRRQLERLEARLAEDPDPRAGWWARFGAARSRN